MHFININSSDYKCGPLRGHRRFSNEETETEEFRGLPGVTRASGALETQTRPVRGMSVGGANVSTNGRNECGAHLLGGQAQPLVPNARQPRGSLFPTVNLCRGPSPPPAISA